MGYVTSGVRIGIDPRTGTVISCQIKSSGKRILVQEGLTAMDVQMGSIRLDVVDGCLMLVRSHPAPRLDRAGSN